MAEYRLVTVEPPFQARRLESRHPVSADDVVVDGRSFNGILMNIFAAQVGFSGRVLAFESDSLNRGRVLRNWKLNGSPAHVELIPMGLWDCQTEIEFCEGVRSDLRLFGTDPAVIESRSKRLHGTMWSLNASLDCSTS
jgi:hypothetical protein